EDLPQEVRQALASLQEAGVRTWLVGGPVRDLLLGRATQDFDFVVEADGLAVARHVADALRCPFVTLDDGRRFGRVVARRGQSPIYLDFAPLSGSSLEEDLRQRDFTINAMAIAVAPGPAQLVDLVGGLADLEAGVIRVASPRAFDADPVRMLRALRFRAELRFRLDPATEALIPPRAGLLARTSWERIRDEMCRILKPAGAREHVADLHRLGLLVVVLPEVAALEGVAQSPPHRHDVLTHTLQVLAEVEAILAWLDLGGAPPHSEGPPEGYRQMAARLAPFTRDLRQHLARPSGFGRSRALLLKWAALLHDVGKPQCQSREPDGRIRFLQHEAVGAQLARDAALRLRLDRREAKALRLMVRHHMRPSLLAEEPRVTGRAIYRYFRDAGEAGVETVLLALADHLATWGPNLEPQRWARRLEMAARLLEAFFVQRRRVVAPPRLVGGRDLLRMGVPQGPLVGRLLEELREAQAEGTVTTREEALAWLRERLARARGAGGETSS
ncbi:MAG: HD domain-containing protein, partial [Anaerolineae bacterium]|nr:HD domain-containing protein [Anaerolineae bacterium]